VGEDAPLLLQAMAVARRAAVARSAGSFIEGRIRREGKGG
jgi:hypothetical protein